MTDTNYAVAPGEFLAEWLLTQSMLGQEAAQRLNLSREHLELLLSGSAPLTPSVAERLAQLTPTPASTWLRHEATYRADLARLSTTQ